MGMENVFTCLCCNLGNLNETLKTKFNKVRILEMVLKSGSEFFHYLYHGRKKVP